MPQRFFFSALMGAIAAFSTILILPAQAQIRQITDVDITPTDHRLVIDLEAEDSEQAQILETYFGNTAVLDLTVTQLAEGTDVYQDVPIKDIDLISVQPLDANSVRIRLVGTYGMPIVTVDRTDTGITLEVIPARKPQITCRRCPAPQYPESALEEKVEGIVRLNLEVDAKGSVTGAQIVGSSGNVSLDRAALEAVLNFKFDPRSLHRQDKTVLIEIPFVIQLDQLPQE